MPEIKYLHPDEINLSEFVEGKVDKKNPFNVEVVVNDAGKVVVFHNREFKHDIGWFECDLNEGTFHFVFDEGEIADTKIVVNETMKKYMQNSHQILTVLLDDESGDAKEGHYYPLILRDV